MFKGEFQFDLYKAVNSRGWWPQYGKTYSSTNEPLDIWRLLTPVKHAPRVLTVAASGDQALTYAMAGARQIDTFDITINACAAMDFKTTALQFLSLKDYCIQSENLGRLSNVQNPKLFNTIINRMPKRTRTLMKNIAAERITLFHRYSHNVFQHETDYQQAQHVVNTPFNFIWANLMNVSNYIEGTYDIINISNIFDYYITSKDIFDTIHSLWPHLSVGGHLLCPTILSNFLLSKRFDKGLADLPAQITKKQITHNAIAIPVIIQKTR